VVHDTLHVGTVGNTTHVSLAQFVYNAADHGYAGAIASMTCISAELGNCQLPGVVHRRARWSMLFGASGREPESPRGRLGGDSISTSYISSVPRTPHVPTAGRCKATQNWYAN
jgi:hypothetical protein